MAFHLQIEFNSIGKLSGYAYVRFRFSIFKKILDHSVAQVDSNEFKRYNYIRFN